MNSFSLRGALACVLATPPEDFVLVVSCEIAANDLFPAHTAWTLCIVRSPSLRQVIGATLRNGDEVRVEGVLERRALRVGDHEFPCVDFIAEHVERLAAPQPGAP